MKYDDGQTVKLGDIVDIGLADGMHMASVVLLGDSGSYAGIDERTAKWAIESKHVEPNGIMAAWVEENPFAHNDHRYAPVSSTISTSLHGVVLVRRKSESQQPAAGDA